MRQKNDEENDLSAALLPADPSAAVQTEPLTNDEIHVGDVVSYSFIEKRKVIAVEHDGAVWLELHHPPVFVHCRVQLDRSRPFRVHRSVVGHVHSDTSAKLELDR